MGKTSGEKKQLKNDELTFYSLFFPSVYLPILVIGQVTKHPSDPSQRTSVKR